MKKIPTFVFLSLAYYSALAADFLSDENIKETQKKMAGQFSDIAKQVDDNAVKQAQSWLPKLQETAGELKYGKHNVVSPEGEQIIALIRSTPANTPESKQSLKKLLELSNRGNPEAMNFLGFVNEHGLFGVKKNVQKAKAFYLASANYSYQPAIYNLGLIALYGKAGQPDFKQALSYFSRAFEVAPDLSYRVCGMASFVAYRHSFKFDRFISGCNSPLATIAYNSKQSSIDGKMMEALRQSFGAGVDDGIFQIERISFLNREKDESFNYCKYALVRKNLNGDKASLKDRAIHCASSMQLNPSKRESVIQGITSFVPIEIESLKKIRESNRFMFSAGVPYLPFAQGELDIFLPILDKK